jgi:cell division protein FtsB
MASVYIAKAHFGPKREIRMKEIWIFLAVVVLWFIIQAYILPKLGVST